MEHIKPGQSGPAVEDVQRRLVSIGACIDADELDRHYFGPGTTKAVRIFRSNHDLALSDVIDDEMWVTLVDATYRMGDRALYLRLPYFHGSDVSYLQMSLNVLGFSCGTVDGSYGPHTEAAVRDFQANVGLFADGMAFQDTFDAIERLHHVWQGKTSVPDFVDEHIGFARAVDVLESNRFLIGATDPIARNVVSRIWNVAYATTNDASVSLSDEFANGTFDNLSSVDIALIIATAPLEAADTLPATTSNIVVQSSTPLASRLRAVLNNPNRGKDSDQANGSAQARCIRLELVELNRYDGFVTSRVVQKTAIMILDALCAALETPEP